MYKFISLLILALTLSVAVSAQQMSDDQVIQYLKEAQTLGKTQNQITTELLRKGVTMEQVERIKTRLESESKQTNENHEQTTEPRLRESGSASESFQNSKVRTKTERQTDLGNAPIDPNVSYRMSESEGNDSRGRIKAPSGGRKIFGREIFSNRYLSFEPNSNIATPLGYRLGPGDEVIIDIWGTSENTIREVISPEGNINVPNLGPLYLNGMTVDEATNYARRELSKIYAGLVEDSSQLKLTLGQIRTIRINIMGEVVVPGTYTLSSFSTVFHALYMAGGVSPIGSLRSIQVVRKGKSIAEIDVYEYIMKGRITDDIRLMEDDVIMVHPYETLINISGKVRRPMYYEMKSNETIADLIKFTGGFTGDAYKNTIRLIRLSGREKQIYNIDDVDFSAFKLMDEDVLSVEAVLDRFENMVEIRGAVYRTGLYQLNGNVNTIKQLIKKADGLRGEAFLGRAQLQREHEDLRLEVIPLDLRGIMDGTLPDMPLQRNDILYIPSIYDLEEQQLLVIHGEVASPGTYIFARNMAIEDLILQAGGLLESASMVRIDIARRNKNPKSEDSSNTIGTTFSFDFKDGYLVGGDNFHLEPFDEVYVRKSPAYFVQKNVQISGEVLFSGTYALTKKNERLSDLIRRAGGLTPDAFIEGARLLRRMSPEEIRRKEDARRMAVASSDSIPLETMDMNVTYPVGINLEKALANPKSNFNLVLREGDVLIVPEFINTVKINGAVMYPNTVSYKEGESMKYYLNQAGGYTTLARKSRAYVVYLNGTVARLKKSSSKAIMPGCEIVIPSKEQKSKMSTTEVVSLGTSVASMAAVVVTLINILK